MNLAVRLAAGSVDPTAAKLPGSLKLNRRLSNWLSLAADGFVDVYPGKVEIGQGILTSLAQIVADELGMPIERLRIHPAETGRSPDEGVTSGSLSIQECGSALRQVAAQVRTIAITHLANRNTLSAEDIKVRDGGFFGPNGRLSGYAELASQIVLDVDANGLADLNRPGPEALIGHSVPRLDLPDKVFGVARFIQDLVLPGMLHGRVLRPPSPDAQLVSLALGRITALSGVLTVLRDGRFVGLVAEREYQADAALRVLAESAQWDETASLPPQDGLGDWLQAQRCESTVIEERGDPDSGAGEVFSAIYDKPFIAHASIGPSCAIAQRDATSLQVWSHTQGPYNLRADLAIAFALPADQVVVRHVEGAGCYGHNPADDVAYDAARLAAEIPGRPVRVLWSRADELAWTPFGPAMRIELSARTGPQGQLVGWRHEVWSNGHSLRPGRAPTPTLLGSWHTDPPAPALPAINAPLAAGGGADRNAVPGYDIAALRVVSHRVLEMPLRSSALRALGAFGNVFAAESFIDEIACHHGVDPLEYRLRHLSDQRGRAVLERAAVAAGWDSKLSDGVRGRGIGYARYKGTGAWCAVIAQVQIEREVRVQRLTIAADVGLAINPDGVASQLEGGAIQATSWALKEAVRFDRTRVLSDSWENYPILGFDEIPQVEVLIASAPDQPSLGAGEASLGPTAAAIANAVQAAIGVRVRSLPITAQQVIAAMR